MVWTCSYKLVVEIFYVNDIVKPLFATQIATIPILTHTHLDIATMIPNVTNIHKRGNR